MAEFLQTTSEALMNHANLRVDEIRVGNKGACLNYNLLDICNEANCSYRHTKANTTAERIKAVKAKLEPAITSYVKEGGGGGGKETEVGHQGLTGCVGAKASNTNKNSAKIRPGNKQANNKEEIVPASTRGTGGNIN